MESLHSRIRLLWIAKGALQALVVGLLLVALDQFITDVPASIIAVVIAIGLVLTSVYAIRLYQIWQYELQDDALYLERGVVTFVETSVPFVRVQHVDTQFGPVERVLGLSSVVVYTAGSRNADVRIPGLTPDRARDLQDALRELAVESEADDAV
ncbi:PH domain-containing protein [Natronorubrum daqingense]|uniref:YdbS-like PH domain-containing protein n=1 Tax=Natronorubrum daqingense TaxID=588898 RepID=A0A1N6X920_9EURY|nr:PH domain-containing protein [Natronorubrum daqingense]APX96013.1 hypothetical protein BB347_04915 [Natronorubrum daqingense]SIQ98845.1 hypothetical protein SAMN05421809_0048 [Natronorubrum daqingense]